MKSKMRVMLLLTMLVIACTLSTPVYAAKLNKKNITISKGEKYTLFVKGTTKKVKWKSSNKKIATVSKNGVVKGEKIGTCRITAKVGKKKYKCTVYVRKFNYKKYLDTVDLDEYNAEYFFQVRVNDSPQLVWSNKNYYCYDYDLEYDYSVDYIVYYDYVDSTGTVQHWFSKGWDSTRYDGEHLIKHFVVRADVKDNAYNIRYEFVDGCNGYFNVIKKSAVKKIIPPYTIVLLNNEKLISIFPIAN